MAQQAHFRGLGGVNTAELNAWEASIPVLARVLSDAGLGAVPVLLEHQLPLISKRVDAVLAGTHPTTGEPSYVVIELKQWSSATSFEGNPELVDGPG
ncbi:MAG: ATP-binding protein, partial [Corynebacterium sp.]|nr:ATP-binding protein [Corynebacterium sp.]